MNKIFKVIYSKTRHCYVVVSELAKSHCKSTVCPGKSKTALTAVVLLALGTFSFLGATSVAQADGTQSLRNNDFVGANEYYWYFDEKTNKWTKYPYWGSDAFNNRSREKVPNYLGGGAKEPGSFAGGLYAQAGQETITIGDRNAGQSRGSVFIGEQGKYNDGGDNNPSEESMHNNYVTAVGFQSNATGWGSIAIGSNAVAENTQETSQVVDYEGSAGTSGTVKDDVYGIKLKPEIKWSSVALGYNAHAKDGNIAIGADSEATDTSSGTPYVSVGNSTLQRRITNVADGAANTDAVTVGQMNKAIESVGATGWTLSTNGSTSGTTIKSGTKVDFSPAVDGKNGTADHSNVAVSNTGSNVKIGLNKDIILGEAAKDKGGSLNVYSDSTEGNNKSSNVSITGSAVSVNRGLILSTTEDKQSNEYGYIAFKKPNGNYTYLHSAADAADNMKDRLEYSGTEGDATPQYIANLNDGITFTGDVKGTVPEGYTQTPTKLNTTLNITGGAATEADLTSGNIGVVSTPAAEKEDGTTQASKLEIKLNKDLKGITSITSQSTTNSTGAKIELGANGTTISGGNVNVSNNKVTGLANGDVSTTSTDAITGQQLNAVKTDLTKDLTVNAGWGIDVAEAENGGKTISLERNLGNNSTSVTEVSNTGLILGGDFSGTYRPDEKYGNYGATGQYAVTLGGRSNRASGESSVAAGGRYNTANGNQSFVGGGNGNVATGSYSANLGGIGNNASGENSVVTGGAYNTASGTKSFVGGGHGNIAVGDYSAVIGGWDNRALGDPYGSSITTVVGGYQNTANGYHAMVSGGYQNVAWGRDTLVSGGRYNTVLGEMEDGWTQQRLSDASAFGGEGSVVQGLGSVGLAGGSTGKTAYLALAAGYQSVVTDGAAKLEANFSDYGTILPVYKDIASAIGYQSTANEAGTISFGHDAGDVSGYTVKWEEDKDPTHDAIDYGSNDYTKTPTVTENYYDDAYYNRLVKVADGIDNHDAVTREQVQYIGGIYGTDKNDSNYGGRGATGTNSVAIGSNAVATEDNVVSFGNPDIPAVNIPESRKITHSVSLSDTDKTAINNVLGFDVTNDENWSKISGFKDFVIVSSLGSATYAQDIQKLENNPEFMELFNKVNVAFQNGTLTQEQIISFEKYANGTEVETTDAVNIPAKAANYRRVVNMADGINPHDAVAMEQLEDYAKTDASNIGNNITVYQTDENGNVQLGDDKKPIVDKEATTKAKNDSKDAWGQALGAGTFTTGTSDKTTDASTSDQLVTGKTLYNYDAPVAETGKKLTYVSANNTTGQNLTALDAQVAANTSTLNDKTHNIKYYSVNDTLLPKIQGKSNEDNKGAQGMGSMAAGFNTYTDGIASTVAGSYSGVINQNGNGGLDFRGATALSYGTFNINQNTDTQKAYSGVANSIIGQANATTDSNAAIIYGAGNTVTNSYRAIDPSKFDLSKIQQDLAKNDAAAVAKDLQDAVSTSGGQVMVMGGGNSVDKAYMTQVTGVGNKVMGADSTYAEGTSTQYNFVDGFQNELTNGKHDYIIGSNNKVSGESVDKNQSNIIFGDNHKLTGQNNNVIIGSSDTADDETAASEVVAIGHNAKVSAEGGVAIGSGSEASVAGKTTEGYDPTTGKASIDTTATWQATNAAVSIGKADGKVTRQINGLAAGTNDTDAVNVAQLKKLNGMKANVVADNIGTKLNAGSTDEEKAAQQTNLNAWGTAIGTGSIAANNGQLVTGSTVFNETRISAKDDNGQAKTYNYLNANNSAGKNLEALDSALKTVSTTAGAHTALTVESNTPAGTGKDAKTNEDVYAGKNILLHESTDATTGKVTYDLKLSKDINIGKPGKDGEDGKIGIDGKDGHIGLNGSDGITVRGLDGENGAPGKDGVTITGPKGEAGKDGIDGKVGISGKDGKDAVSISGKDGVGHIGLTGPAGTNGKDGTNAIDITVKNGYDGANGINGKNGVDGTSLTRIVYTDKTGEHQVATMEDGLKFKGDDTTVINKKLNNTMEIIGGAKGDLTENNIGVNSTKEGKLKVQLSKNLTGMNSTTYTTTTGEGDSATTSTTVVNGNGLTITNGPSITNKGVDGGNKVITNVGSGIEKDADGKYTVTDQNKGNAANVGDVQNMVNDAKKELTDGANGLNKKANIDASNIGTNLKNADGSAASTDAQKANAEKWGSAIGTGEIKADDGRMVTGKTVYDEVRPTEDGNYVKKDQTTGENLSALDSKIGKLDKDGNYIKKDDSISNNLSTLDTQVKNNADAIQKNSESIQNITNNVKNLSDNAVQYDKDSNKSKVTLAGKDGTTITNVKDGALSDSSTEAVNGKQLYNEQQAREAADKAITEKVTNNTNEITKIKNGDFTDASKTAIHNIAKDAVEVVAGTNTKVTKTEGTDTTPTKYTVNVEGNGKVASGDTGLISGDTLYKEVHVDKDGSYIKSSQSVGQNLSALDTGLKTTSDLIHTNDKGDTIQIGGNSMATKIDVNGKDGKGRVITGVVTDAGDPNSAANVGYVNGLTAANTQQIYRDMSNAYSRLDTNINRAAAGSNALAALHPLDFDPDDKASFAVGYGHYHNANAAAVGAFYQPNANTMVNMGISLGNGDPGFNAGVSFKIGKGSAYNGVSKAEMAQTIHDQAAEISTIKANDAAKDKRIDALEKENQEMKKQIQEILARLNG